MPPSLVKMLRDLADAYEREEKGEQDSELREEIAKLKAAIAEKPKSEREEALEEITDEEYALIVEHRKAVPTPAADPTPAPAADPTPPAAKTRPGRKSGQAYTWTVDDDGKVQRVDIPLVYSGPDEADEVELPAEEEQAAA